MSKVVDAIKSRAVLIEKIRQLEAEMHEVQISAGLSPRSIQSVCMEKLEDADLIERRDRLRQRLDAGYDVSAREAVIREPFREAYAGNVSR